MVHQVFVYQVTGMHDHEGLLNDLLSCMIHVGLLSQVTVVMFCGPICVCLQEGLVQDSLVH